MGKLARKIAEDLSRLYTVTKHYGSFEMKQTIIITEFLNITLY